MSTFTTPNTFDNGEVISATEHNENWNQVASFVNGLSAGNNFDTGAIQTATIADNAITNAKLAGGAVITSKINDGAVTTVKLADDAVTTVKIVDSNVTTAKIADSNVTTAKIADSNVTTAKVADSNITTAKIADANVTEGKLANSAVTNAKIADGAVTSAKIADGTIVDADISGTAAISLSKLGSGTASISISGNAATATSASSASSATLASKASTLAQGGGNGTAMTFNWSGQSGQPSWLWGSNDGSNIYVYNPSNFSVSYASGAGNADTVDNAHADENSNGSTVLLRTAGGGARAVSFTATGGSSSSFYDQGANYTYLGLACMRVRNDDYVYSTTITSGRTVLVNSSQTLGTSTSTRKVKENIQPYEDVAKRILNVSPVTFDYKESVIEEDERANRFNQFGMIAEDLHDAGLTHLVHYDKDNQPEAINYMMLSVELLGVVKQQQSAINDLAARVTALEGR